MRYPVVIHKDPNSDYGVTVPDVAGCFSAGATLDEALSEVVEAIEAHLEGMQNPGALTAHGSSSTTTNSANANTWLIATCRPDHNATANTLSM